MPTDIGNADTITISDTRMKSVRHWKIGLKSSFKLDTCANLYKLITEAQIDLPNIGRIFQKGWMKGVLSSPTSW